MSCHGRWSKLDASLRLEPLSTRRVSSSNFLGDALLSSRVQRSSTAKKRKHRDERKSGSSRSRYDRTNGGRRRVENGANRSSQA